MKRIIAIIASLVTAFSAHAGDIFVYSSTIPTNDITAACESQANEYSKDTAIVVSISHAYKCDDATKLAVKLVGYDKYIAIPTDTTTIRNKVVNSDYIDTSDIVQAYALQIALYNKSNTVFFDWSWSRPTQYGMDDKFEFKLDSWANKAYKYVTVYTTMYNAVDDKIKSQVFRGIGPVIKYGFGSWTFDNQHFDMYNVSYIQVNKVVLTDMNNKQVSYTNKELSKLFKSDADRVIDNTLHWFKNVN